MHFFNKMLYILIHISVKFVSKGFIVNQSSLIYVLDWFRAGNTPLHERKNANFYAANWRHNTLSS